MSIDVSRKNSVANLPIALLAKILFNISSITAKHKITKIVSLKNVNYRSLCVVMYFLNLKKEA
jgi:hypothetical protein